MSENQLNNFCMRSICSLSMVCLFTLIACGNVNDKDHRISYRDSVKIRQYEHKSIVRQNTAPDAALYFAEKGLKLSRRLHYKFGEGLMLGRFAAINGQFGNLKLAVKYQKQALEIFKSLKKTKESIEAVCSLGLFVGRQGNVKAGTSLIEEALKAYQQNKDTAGMAKANFKLGELNELNGHPDAALKYYGLAEQFRKGTPMSDDYLTLIDHIGRTNSKLGRHKEALNYYQAGIANSGGPQHTKAQIAFLNHAGTALNVLGNKTEALAYQEQSLQKSRESGLPEEEVRSLIAVAATLKGEDASLSITHLKNALGIARSIGHKQLSSEIYKSLSDMYRQQSRYEEALIALEQHHNLLDSVQNANKVHKIAVLQSSYELAESKLHIETLKLSNKQKTYQRNLSLLSALAILVILAILAIYFVRTARLNKRLQESNQVKDKLFSIIGHDLRNPIGGITQLLAIMDEEELDPKEYHAMISEMRKQGDVSLEILNALLNWGEAQLKGIHVKPSNFNAEDIITKNIAALQLQASAKSVLISTQVAPDLTIYGDANHFDFIIRNLLSNAIKFSHPSGEISIMADANAMPGQVVFSVKDNGKGISKAQQELFLKSNLDISFGTDGEKGTGIGLMLSKEFIKANDGKIWIASEEGKGSTFYFSFKI
jgi:signal transduction histidine kinase